MIEFPERQFNVPSAEAEQRMDWWQHTSEKELKYLDALGGHYRGLVDGTDGGERYEDVWRDVKAVYNVSEPVAKASIETRAYGKNFLRDDSQVEGYMISITFEPFDGGETKAFKFDVNALAMGVPQGRLDILADKIHNHLVHGLDTLPRNRSHIQGEIERDMNEWKSESGDVPTTATDVPDPASNGVGN